MCYSPMVQKSLKFLEAEFGVTPVRDSFAAYETLHELDPKKFPDFSREQIFPGHFAPVVTSGHIEPMRYGAWPSPDIDDPGRYSTYNARAEKLASPFWLGCPELATGVVKVKAFLEWVLVADLLKDKKVRLAEVEEIFAAKAAARKKSAEDSGKKFRPSESEKKPAKERKVTILIAPDHAEELYVPVLVSRHAPARDFKGPRGGFAIITGPAPAEITKAGHDRCPLHLTHEAALEWLKAKPLERASLKRQQDMHFKYRLSGA
jgi:putative SOS response-associated peptidase YedK